MPRYVPDRNHVVAASLIHTLDWRQRKIKLIAKAEQGVLNEVLSKLIPLIGASQLINNLLQHND